MEKRIFYTFLFLSIKLFSLGQANENFTNYFIKNYKELSKPPLNNYFVVLNNTVNTNFNMENPFFVDALNEIKKDKKVTERNALDSLFNINFKMIRQNSVWISSPEILNQNKDFFKVYNDEICPCLTSKVKKNDFLEKMIDAQKSCFSNLMTDTFLLRQIREKGGNKTLNELYKLQPYFAMYFYENCNILNYKFNETLNNLAVEQYTRAITKYKIEDVKDLIRFFDTKKFDSLKLLFPKYLSFIKDLQNFSEIYNQKETRSSFFYTGGFNNIEKNIIVTISNNEKIIGEYTFANSTNEFLTNIYSLKFKKYKQRRSNNKEQILEIRTDRVRKN